MKSKALVLPLIASLSLAACVPTTSTTSTTYPAVAQQTVFDGTITNVQQVVQTNPNAGMTGALVGGVAGGLLGNQFGNGSGNAVMTGLGAAAGMAAGANMAQANSTHTALQWTVRLDDGRSVSIVQNENFKVGQKVRVQFTGNGGARIIG